MSLCIYLFCRQNGGQADAFTDECNIAPWPTCISNRFKESTVYFFPSGKYTERWRWERKSEQPNHSLPTADIVLYSFRVKLSSLNVCLTYIQVCKDVKKKNINTSVKAQLCYPLGESCLVHFKHQEIMLTTWFKATDSEVN